MHLAQGQARAAHAYMPVAEETLEALLGAVKRAPATSLQLPPAPQLACLAPGSPTAAALAAQIKVRQQPADPPTHPTPTRIHAQLWRSPSRTSCIMQDSPGAPSREMVTLLWCDGLLCDCALLSRKSSWLSQHPKRYCGGHRPLTWKLDQHIVSSTLAPLAA